jgi:fumarylpyruvate hydrolase
MTKYVHDPKIASVQILGSSELYPIHRVFCVGRNYADHAREMGHDHREPPFFFMKPSHAVNHSQKHPYPDQTSNYHFEIELVIAIGKGGARITTEQAIDHVYGYAVGIDFTRRDLQQASKDKGRPWETGKSFDLSAPISPIKCLPKDFSIKNQRITLSVNNQVKQDSTIGAMIWSVEEIIAHLSIYFELQPGDLIFSGTPAGVGAVVTGDQLSGSVSGVGQIKIDITE